MVRGILDWFTALLGGDEQADSDEAEKSRFLPSVLDSSVRYAHGQNNPDGEREIAKINREAQRREGQLRRK